MNLSRSFGILCLVLALLAIPASAVGRTAGPGGVLLHLRWVQPLRKRKSPPPGDWLETHSSLVVVEYELATRPGNYAVLAEMDRTYHTGLTVPFVFVSSGTVFTGDTGILSGVPTLLEALERDPASRPAGSLSLESLDPASLSGMPGSGHGDRILIRTGPGGDGTVLRSLLSDPDPAGVLGRPGGHG